MTEPRNRLQVEPANEVDNKKKKAPWERFNMPPLSTAALMEIFDFNEQDLMANRNGFATNAQRSRLGEELREDADSMWLMLTILLIPAAVVALIMVMEGLPLMSLVIGAGILIGAMLAFAYRRQTGMREDAEKLKVRSVEGDMMVLPGIGEARVIIGDQRFRVSLPQAKALSEYFPGVVRVYHSANGRQILSAEALREVNVDKLKVEDLQEDDSADLILEAERQDDEQMRR